MSAASSTEIIFSGVKHIVSIYDGRERVARIIFRDGEQSLAEQCLTAASDVDATNELAVLTFCDSWYEKMAAEQDVRGGSGFGRPPKYQPRRVWHSEGV